MSLELAVPAVPFQPEGSSVIIGKVHLDLPAFFTPSECATQIPKSPSHQLPAVLTFLSQDLR